MLESGAVTMGVSSRPDFDDDPNDRSWWWKTCQQLRNGDSVQIVVSSSPEGAADSFSDGAQAQSQPSSSRYTAWVEDIEDDKIILSLRLEHALALNLKIGQAVTFKRPNEDGMWVYEGVVSADRAIRIEITRPLKATKIQRREYCRVPIEAKTWFSSKSKAPEKGSGIARDISGGGLSLSVNHETPVGETLEVDVPLGNDVVRMQGIVRRVAAEGKAGGGFLLGVQFVNPLLIDQDKIIGFVFTRQRDLRKKRR
jgi:c-di-GMP-binding flagellar brake protein YcgR